jgi:hypothetical protein
VSIDSRGHDPILETDRLHRAPERRQYPRWEPHAGKLNERVCAGAQGNSHPYRAITVSPPTPL